MYFTGITRFSCMDALRSPHGNKLSMVVPLIRGSTVPKKEGAVAWLYGVLISVALSGCACIMYAGWNDCQLNQQGSADVRVEWHLWSKVRSLFKIQVPWDMMCCGTVNSYKRFGRVGSVACPDILLSETMLAITRQGLAAFQILICINTAVWTSTSPVFGLIVWAGTLELNWKSVCRFCSTYV